MIKQAIIPLAGLGTRLLPLTSVFAKELLPINGKPGIEYILDECINAGIKEGLNGILIEHGHNLDFTGDANVVKNWEEIYNLIIDNT